MTETTHYEQMKKVTKPPVDINVIKVSRIKTKHYGMMDIYTIKPCKTYSEIELRLAANNNPSYLIYDKKHNCFYANYFGYVYLAHECNTKFYALFLEAMRKNDAGLSYLDAAKKYLKQFAEIQDEV